MVSRRRSRRSSRAREAAFSPKSRSWMHGGLPPLPLADGPRFHQLSERTPLRSRTSHVSTDGVGVSVFNFLVGAMLQGAGFVKASRTPDERCWAGLEAQASARQCPSRRVCFFVLALGFVVGVKSLLKLQRTETLGCRLLRSLLASLTSFALPPSPPAQSPPISPCPFVP